MKQTINVKEITCETCHYFRRHYVHMGWRYQEISCGHCVYPRLKHRMANMSACVHYRSRNEEDG